MLRRSPVVVLGAALAVGSLSGCAAKAGGTLTAGAQTPEPAPAPPPPPSAPAPEPEHHHHHHGIMRHGGRIELPGNIVFDTGSASMSKDPQNEDILHQLREFLHQNPDITKLRIEGYTDNVGAPAANIELSGQRALTIKKWLVDHGVAKDRLIAVGFGPAKPVADNATDEGKAQNRRTEFHIAEIKGKKYLGADETGGGKVFHLHEKTGRVFEKH
jgi:OmpA-OmpF porin, OOP family